MLVWVGVLAPTRPGRHALLGERLRVGAPPRRGMYRTPRRTCGRVRFARGARAPRARRRAGRPRVRISIIIVYCDYELVVTRNVPYRR